MKNFKIFNKDFQIPEIQFKHNSIGRRIFWGFLFFLVTVMILGINFMPQKITLEAGQPSQDDFVAPHDLSYESEVLTDLAREEAAAQVNPVYKFDDNVLRDINHQLDEYFDSIAEIKYHREDSEENHEDEMEDGIEEKVERFNDLDLDLSDEYIIAILEDEESALEEVNQESKLLIEGFIEEGLRAEEVENVKSNIIDEVQGLNIPEEYRELLTAIFEKLPIKQNVIFDPEATEKLKEEARQEIEPVRINISEDQKIVGRGEIITEFQVEQLERLELLDTQQPYSIVIGLALFVAIMFFLILSYLHQNKRNILQNEHLLVLLGLLFLITLIIARTVIAINLGNEDISALAGYIIPLAAGSMLIAILLDGKLAILMTLFMGIIIGVMTGNQIQYAIVAIVGGMAGIYSVSDLSQRSDLAKASLYIILANVFAILSMSLMMDQSLTSLTISIAFGIINGILSSVLAIGLLPFFETAFGITTAVKLLELSNPNQPLLKRLLLEAPGTYHHSIVVSNLAESAADEVGADSLLARVGAYYHDIGKIKRPYFFIENQLTVENPHDKLTPTLSALIITSHVKDGYELARENKLPEDISEIVLRHHGNSLLSYFYQKAIEKSSKESEVPNEKFRYDCPKPHTKETAIVMLADTVEAGVRAMNKPTPNKIEAFIKRIIKEKLDDGQLDECDLTFKELNLISNAFIRVLSGIFHHRIEYPENLMKEVKGGATSKNGNNNKEQPRKSKN